MLIRIHAMIPFVLSNMRDALVNIYRQWRTGNIIVIHPETGDALASCPLAEVPEVFEEAIFKGFEARSWKFQIDKIEQ